MLSSTTRPAPRLPLWPPPPWPGLEISRFKPDIYACPPKLRHRWRRRAPRLSKLQVRPTSRRCSRLSVGRETKATSCIAATQQTVCRRVRNSEIPMADPDDRTRREAVSPDGRPRRQPPIIDAEAVELSLDGSRPTTAGPGPGASPSGARGWPRRIFTFPPPGTFAIIGSACVIAAIIAGALWIYLAADGANGPQRNAASPEAPPAQASPPPYPPPQAGEGRVGALESRIAALDAMLAPLGDRIAALERAVRDAAAAARAGGERADRAGDEQNRTQPNDRTALEALANRVTALESRQTALQQKQEGLDRLASAVTTPDKAIRIATVALALRYAVERNSPFTPEFAAP